MKKILQIGMTSEYGGVEAFLINLYKNIDRNKFQFDFVYMDPDNRPIAYADEIKKLGGKILKIPSRHENILKNNLQLKKIINEGNYSYIHNNLSSWSNATGIKIALKLKNTKIIVHSHNTEIDGIIRKILHKLNKHYNNSSEIIRLACGEEAGKWLFGNKKFTVIPNGVDTKLYKFNQDVRNEYRKKFNVDDGKVFLNVGRLSHQKNHYYLINLFANIVKTCPNSYLFLVGNGELHDELVEYVNKLHLSSKIIFLGIRHDVPNLMQMSDCFLFPSFYEGLPIVLIEAQATGLPCLVSNKISKEIFITPYIKEMDISSNSDRYVSEALNLSQLKINRETGIDYVRKARYDIEDTVKMMEEIYSGNYSFN